MRPDIVFDLGDGLELTVGAEELKTWPEERNRCLHEFGGGPFCGCPYSKSPFLGSILGAPKSWKLPNAVGTRPSFDPKPKKEGEPA